MRKYVATSFFSVIWYGYNSLVMYRLDVVEWVNVNEKKLPVSEERRLLFQ